MKRIRLSGWALVLLPLWTEAAQRPTVSPARQKAEQRIEKLEERLNLVQLEGPRSEADLEMARRNADLARKLLKVNNLRAAGVLTDAAERHLDQVERREAETATEEQP